MPPASPIPGCSSGEVCKDSTQTRLGGATLTIRCPLTGPFLARRRRMHPSTRCSLNWSPVTISTDRPVAVITGASSGIGAATARELAGRGFHVFLGARRTELSEKIAAEIDGTALPLDVTDVDSVSAFAAAIPTARVLVNNAGGAKGMAPVRDADEEHWRWMWETNVLGTLR